MGRRHAGRRAGDDGGSAILVRSGGGAARGARRRREDWMEELQSSNAIQRFPWRTSPDAHAHYVLRKSPQADEIPSSHAQDRTTIHAPTRRT